MWRARRRAAPAGDRDHLDLHARCWCTVGAFGIWWGGTAAPARPIASGLPLLMLPIAAAFRSAPAGSPRRAAQHLLLWIGVGIAITLAIGQDGLLINNARDGTSALLDFWSPRWQLWSLAPTLHRQRLGPSRGCTPPGGWSIAGGAPRCCCRACAARAPACPRWSRSRRSRSRCWSSRSPFRWLPTGRAEAARSTSARGRGSPRSTDLMRGRGPRRSSTTRCARAPPSMRCRS